MTFNKKEEDDRAAELLFTSQGIWEHPETLRPGVSKAHFSDHSVFVCGEEVGVKQEGLAKRLEPRR